MTRAKARKPWAPIVRFAVRFAHGGYTSGFDMRADALAFARDSKGAKVVKLVEHRPAEAAVVRIAKLAVTEWQLEGNLSTTTMLRLESAVSRLRKGVRK